MKELEVKVLDIDLEKLRENLLNIGAKLNKKENQINTIYDYEDNSFETNENGYIRIRETKDLIEKTKNIYFTIKKIISNNGIKEYEETEVEVSSKEELEKILFFLKIYKKHRGEKYREEYLYQNIRYHIDIWDIETVPFPYLEIEVEEKKDLKKALNVIGYSEEDISLKTIKELKEGETNG